MMAGAAPGYNGPVHVGWGRGALVTLVATFCSLVFAVPVRADEQFDVGPSPVLNVHVNHGQVTIQTWDRPQVLISSDNPADVRHLAPGEVDPRIPKQLQMASQRIETEHGPVTLPAESFVLPELPGAQHDAIVARGSGNMTITIPRGTAMVMAHLRAGRLSLNGYQGVFVTHVRSAEVSLNDVGGTGFVESLRGRVLATNSSFDRLRVRTATGNMLFQGCTSHQIQATSAYGSIVYDNGNFQPGLARFESEHGNVALGVRGSAQIGAHSGSGHVISSFHDEAQVHGDPTTKQATVGGGGPVVTATSKNGSVYLYSGSMNEHPHVRQELSGSTRLPVETVSPEAAPARAPQHAAPPSRPPAVRQGRPPR
jgi:Putative adhesin